MGAHEVKDNWSRKLGRIHSNLGDIQAGLQVKFQYVEARQVLEIRRAIMGVIAAIPGMRFDVPTLPFPVDDDDFDGAA